MKLGSLDRAGFLRLLLRLQGSGYSTDEDSNVYKERDAIAYIMSKVAETMESAFGNVFLSSAVSLLDALEDVRFLQQGSTRLDAVRQSRLLAFLRSLPMVPSRVANGFAGHVGATTGSTLRPTLAQLQAHWASPLGGFAVGRREPAATDPLVRRDLAVIMQRGLPGRAIFTGLSTKDATWGDALDPASIKLAPVVTIAAQTKARVAPQEFLPSQVVTREDWIELQAQLCWKSRGFSIDQDAQGRMIFVSASLSSGGTSVDTTIDWSNRLLQAWGVVGGVGLVNDPTTLGPDAHGWLPPSKLGPAGAGYTHTLYDTQYPTAASLAVTFAVNGSGHLVITNTSGGTVDVRMFVRSTPEYTPGSTTDTQPWIDSVQIQHDDVAELYASTVVSDVDDGGQFAGENAGAIRRVVYTGPMTRDPDVGIPQGVVLDTSEDWRNRWVLVCSKQTYTSGGFPVLGAFTSLFPVDPYRSNAPRLFFTGAGQAMGNSSVLANQHSCSTTISPDPVPDGTQVNNAWLFARDTDGALVIEMKDGTSDWLCYTGLLLLTATEQTTGDSVVTPVPVHTTQVQTIDLEQPQNTGCYAQGRQGNVPRYLLTDPAPKARPTCPAMGLLAEGHSPVRPASWVRREMLGAIDDAGWECRQPIERQRKRLVSIAVPNATEVPVDDFNLLSAMTPGLNDQVDFRDRFLWVEGRYSSTDIRIANASQQSDTTAESFVGLLYTGPGGSLELNLDPATGVNVLFLKFEFSRAGANKGYHSRLLIRNATGVTQYLNFTVEVSGYLGFTDRRAIGA